MNDHELDRALDAIHHGRTDLIDSPQLHERAFAVPLEYPQQRGWLPRIETRGFTMFSAVKFIAAAAIVALFGGFLLAGMLTTQQGDEAVPAAVTDSPEPDGSGAMAFPTGSLVSEQNRYLLLEFEEDGTGFLLNLLDSWNAPLSYAVDDDRYTVSELTYHWDYDGGRLAFVELVSGDAEYFEKFVYQDNTYRPIEDPRIVVVAAADMEAGKPIPDWKLQRGFVPAAEVGATLYMDPEAFVGRVPLAPIAKGEPITMAMVLPAE